MFVFAHRLVLLCLRVRQCWLSAVRGEVVGDGGVEGWICSGVYVEKAEKVVLRFELCGALSRSLMMGPTSPSLFGVLAPHTGLQDDTHSKTVSILLLCRPALRRAHLVISQ
jgi:hypothetical protein